MVGLLYTQSAPGDMYLHRDACKTEWNGYVSTEGIKEKGIRNNNAKSQRNASFCPLSHSED